MLSFEFLFRTRPPPGPEDAEAFQRCHQNYWLKQFRRDFAKGFEPERIDAAVGRTDERFRHLDNLLSDGRRCLGGDEFSLSDVAWMPNFHRFDLMGWPFERTPNLKDWFESVSARPSYLEALLNWQPDAVRGAIAEYTRKRRSEGTDIRAFGRLSG
ncbi:MAG: glutathione S-transferase family protein [Boseongicola sp. SB0676_bin_33]|nr:glutathione S-transferase family protein [Boseongicola sp. SB0676_bin_33]